MNFDDLPEIDLGNEDLPTLDLDVAEGKPRPSPPRPRPRPSKKPRQPVQPAPPDKLPYGIKMKDVTDFLTGKDPESIRRRQIQEATQAYESTLIKEPPPPHKFVPKAGPPIRDLGAEEAQFEQMLKDAETRQDRERYEAKLAGRTAPSTGAQMLSHFGRGYAGSMKSMLKGPTLLNKNARTDPSTKFLYQTPQEEEATMQMWLPVNKYDNSFKMRAAEAIGSTVPFMLGGAAAETAGLPGWMMSGVLGASSNASQTYDEAIASGMDEMQSRQAAVFGALIGMTEALGIGKMKAPGIERPAFATPIMSRLLEAGRHFGKEGVEEWVQEYGSQVLNNVNAMIVSGYDPKRAIQEGVWDAGSLGFLTGFGMAGGMHMIGGSINARDPDYMAAKKEYVQAQAIDKAFKNFLNTQQIGDPRQIKVRDSGKIATPPQFRTAPLTEAPEGAAKIPPPQGYTPPVPKPPPGRALKPGPPMPMWDMGLMTQGEDEAVPWNYSQLEKVVTEKFPNKMMPDQAMAMLSPYGSKYGIKQEEYTRTGIDELIARKAVKGEPVTKDELLKIIRDASLGIQEVVKGGLAVNNEATQALRDDLADARVQIDQFRIHTDSLVRQQAELDKIFQEGGMEWEEYSGSIDKLSEQVRQNERESLAVQRRIAEMEGQLSTGVDDTRYGGYKALGGGTPGSYRELLITLPKNEPDLEPADWTTAGGGGDTANFVGGHFNEPNILVHARLDEGTDADGNKILRIQEIQSDWHQQGREKGYFDPKQKQTAFQKLKVAQQAYYDSFANFFEKARFGQGEEEADEFEMSKLQSDFDHTEEGRMLNQGINEAHGELQPLLGATPDAPFKSNWHELAFKRLIRWAADRGYQRMVWTTGGQQIDLYQGELRRNVDTISLLPSQYGRKGSYDLIGWKDGKKVVVKDMLDEEAVKDYIGPQIMQTLLEKLKTNPNRADVSGNDLSIGGQMHKLLYDQKLPQLARDYARKFGGQTGKTQVRVDTNDDTSPVEREPIYKDVHYLDLSPKLTETAIQTGFPLYTHSGREGGVSTGDDLRFDVIPGLGGETGNAPYMLVPRWVMTAIGEGKSGGFNFSTNRLGEYLKKIRKGAPSDRHANVATKALFDMVDQSLDAGLNSVSLIPHDQTETGMRGAIEHEVFHAATRAGLTPKLGWVMNHPLLREIIDRPVKRTSKNGEEIVLPSVRDLYFSDLKGDDAIKLLSMEIPAYTVEGRLDILGISPADGIDFTFDLFNHLRTEYGQEGIDKLRSLARMRPEMVEAFDLAQSMWDDWQEELKSGDRAVQDGDVWFDEMEPFRIGDNVYSPENPEFGVMRTLSDDGESAMVRGPRGIAHMAKKALKKVKGWINTEAGKEVLDKNPLAPDVPEEGPPDEPPPPPPRQPGGGAGGDKGPSSLFKEHLSPEAVQLLGRTYKAMLEAGGIDADPLLAPFEQVIAAINDGKLHNVYIDEIMEREGIPMSEFSRSMAETASDAGKVLQVYSEIARFWNSIIDEWEVHEGLDDPKGRPTGGKTGPKIPGANLEAMYRMIPIDVRVQRALRGVRATALGKSMWQRAGNVTQKAMLTQLSTFAVNSITTGGQLPLKIVTYGMGAWMHQMGEGKGSFMQRLSFAHDEGMDAMWASCEVLKALNPWQFAQWAMHQKNSTKFAEYQNIVHRLERVFPDIKKKLFALSTGTETLQTGKRQLSIAKRLVPLVRDQAKREALLKDMKMFEERLDANGTAFGKLLNGTEAAYDLCLWPMQFAEYLLRRPMFVGHLTLELQREGYNLSQLLATNQLSRIKEETMEKAVNKALEFTYAYMPGTKTGTDYKLEKGVERAAMKAIEWLNQHGGPLNALIGEPFGKAMFNGAKFVYEYSPVGAIFPANRIVSNWGKEKTVAELNSQIRFGGQQGHAARAVTMKGVINDPLTGKKTVIHKTTHNDYDRLAKAMVGTMMYAAVAFLRHYYGGPEWWQLDLGEKGADGRPVYFDMRRHKPFSVMFQVVDLVERMATGNLGDQDPIAIASEVMTGIRMYDNQMGGNIIQATSDWFRHEDVTTEAAYYKGQEEFGQMMAVYITPLINLRDCIAQFSKEENVKKDTRGSYSVLGPVMDKIPYLRRLLPNLTSPVEPSPIPLSKNPAIAQLTGLKKEIGQNFAGREWRRLGLYNKTFLSRMTDPVSNRAQNEYFQEVAGAIGEELEKDSEYQAMDDLNKAALWEDLLKGVAADARKIGKAQNPVEAAKDEVRGSVPGRLRRKAMGLEKELKEIKE